MDKTFLDRFARMKSGHCHHSLHNMNPI